MRRQAATLDRKNRRLSVLRELQAVGWPLEAQPAQRLAKRRISLRKRLAADVEPRGKALPHPDLLRTLTRKDERNHDGREPDGAPWAISRARLSTRC